MTSTFPFAQWPGLGPSDGGRDSADRGLPGSVGKPRDVMAKRRVEPSCEAQGVRLGRPREAMAQLMTYESQDGAPFLSRLDGQSFSDVDLCRFRVLSHFQKKSTCVPLEQLGCVRDIFM